MRVEITTNRREHFSDKFFIYPGADTKNVEKLRLEEGGGEEWDEYASVVDNKERHYVH